MLKMNKGFYLGSSRNNYFTTSKYSTFNNSLAFQQRSLSQIKRDNELSKQQNRRYIESMYKSGSMFKYDLNPPHRGTHRSHLQNIEYKVRNMIPELDFEKNRLNIFNTQCTNLRMDLKDDYKVLKKEMQEEVDILQNKLIINLNRQKIENQKLQQQIKAVKNDFIEPQNLAIELKKRIDSLKLRIDGKKMYNEIDIPTLDTKID